MILQQKMIAKRGRRLYGALAAGLLALSPLDGAMADSLTVSTDSGPVQGTVTRTMREFLGIPYAAPPIGELRWQPPQPAPRWKKPRDATHFAPHCAQNASPFGVASVSEDCLYLNVYTPKRGGGNHPVMVWIHGGALVVGESDDYVPDRIIEQGDVVVVTINY